MDGGCADPGGLLQRASFGWRPDRALSPEPLITLRPRYGMHARLRPRLANRGEGEADAGQRAAAHPFLGRGQRRQCWRCSARPCAGCGVCRSLVKSPPKPGPAHQLFRPVRCAIRPRFPDAQRRLDRKRRSDQQGRAASVPSAALWCFSLATLLHIGRAHAAGQYPDRDSGCARALWPVGCFVTPPYALPPRFRVLL